MLFHLLEEKELQDPAPQCDPRGASKVSMSLCQPAGQQAAHSSLEHIAQSFALILGYQLATSTKTILFHLISSKACGFYL